MKKNNVAANGSMNLSSDNKKLLVGAPILRLGSLDTPIPFSQKLEKEIYFPIHKIKESIKKLIEY